MDVRPILSANDFAPTVKLLLNPGGLYGVSVVDRHVRMIERQHTDLRFCALGGIQAGRRFLDVVIGQHAGLSIRDDDISPEGSLALLRACEARAYLEPGFRHGLTP